MDAVKSGDVKINAATLYPYNVIETLERSSRDVAEAQWNALPNYVEGDNNFLVMATILVVSVSRICLPHNHLINCILS